MRNVTKYWQHIASAIRRWMLPGLMIWFLCLGAQAQDTGGSMDSDQSKVGEELDQFVNRFLDWVVLSYATYTGAHDAELESIFAKAKTALDNQPEVQALLQDIKSSSNEEGLEQLVRDFTNKTGIGVYFVPQIVNQNDGFYVPIFNDFLAEGAKNPIAPYVIVKPVIDGNHKSGYNISYSIETSPDLNPKKYNLDQSNNGNPFNGIAGSIAKRKELASKFKPNLALGVKTLTETVNENFLPKLVITYEGNVYRPGEEIEVGMDPDSTAGIRLIARNRDGTEPKRSVVWSFAPETVERKVRGSDLVFPLNTAGQWAIMAESGSLKATVGVKVVNFNLDWKSIMKEILKEVVNESIAVARAKIDSLAAAGSQDQLLEEYKEILVEDGFDLTAQPPASFSMSFEMRSEERVLTDSEFEAYFRTDKKRRFLDNLGTFMIAAAQIALQVEIETYLNTIIDDPNQMNGLVEDIKESSPELIIELVTNLASKPDTRSDIKKIVIDFLNQRINEVANSN